MSSQQQNARLSISDWSKNKIKEPQQQTSEYESKCMRVSAVEDLKQLNVNASWDLERRNERLI